MILIRKNVINLLLILIFILNVTDKTTIIMIQKLKPLFARNPLISKGI